jgi:hypothetical protein
MMPPAPPPPPLPPKLPPMPGMIMGMHAPPPPPMPMSMSMSPQGFMQPPMQSMGPTRPVIFEGHIVNNSKGKDEVFQEICFGFPFKLEGIHIVPNQVTPPGLSLVGRTKPDISQRQFQFQLHGRVASTNEIVFLLGLSVHGGVQWLPVPHPSSTLDLDYLVFIGDYEEITVMLHGFPIIPPNEINPNTSKPLAPYPFYFNDLLISNKEMTDIRKFLPFFSKQNERNTYEYVKKTYERQSNAKSIKEILTGLPPLSSEGLDSHFYLSRVTSTHQKSLLPVKSLAQLVEKIFSLNGNVQLAALEDYEILETELHSLQSIFKGLHQVKPLSSDLISFYFMFLSSLETAKFE